MINVWHRNKKKRVLNGRLALWRSTYDYHIRYMLRIIAICQIDGMDDELIKNFDWLNDYLSWYGPFYGGMWARVCGYYFTRNSKFCNDFARIYTVILCEWTSACPLLDWLLIDTAAHRHTVAMLYCCSFTNGRSLYCNDCAFRWIENTHMHAHVKTCQAYNDE